MIEAEPLWQPMDTAPKDGTRIVLWCVHPNARFSDDPIGEGWAAPVVGHWIDHNGGGWTWTGLAGVHTLWAPVPGVTLPQVAGERQDG